MSVPSSGGGSCPICGKGRDVQFRPFCSKRCADIDLGRWLKGDYVIPGAPLDVDIDAPEASQDPELH